MFFKLHKWYQIAQRITYNIGELALDNKVKPCFSSASRIYFSIFYIGFKGTFCNNKYRIAPSQITNTEIFTFNTVLVFKLLSRTILFLKRKYYGNCCKVINSYNAKFSGYFWNTQAIIYQYLFNLHDCTLK